MSMELKDLPPKMQAQALKQIAQQDANRRKELQPKKKKQSKYNNQPCEVAGIKFDSKKEARRYMELKGKLDAGLITDLRLQHHFTLQEAWTSPQNDKIGKIEYVADFTYKIAETGEFCVEDVKSEITKKNPAYVMKKKLMAEKGYMIQEV